MRNSVISGLNMYTSNQLWNICLNLLLSTFVQNRIIKYITFKALIMHTWYRGRNFLLHGILLDISDFPEINKWSTFFRFYP